MIPTVVFDFDGTLAVGHGPVLAYARELAPVVDGGYLARIHAELVAFDAGASRYRDGYDIVGSLARDAGADADALTRAYRASRAHLGTDRAAVETMPGLDGFLARLKTRARIVLATNAPAEGIDPLLDRWGVRELFDAVHVAAGKPEGLSAIIREALARGPVLAVGDIVEYDLAPAMALGADTALVGATADARAAEVTMRGGSLAELSAAIEAWAATAAAPADPATDVAVNPIER